MSRHEARGTKRICQNEECTLPFYDLNRLECSCPNCGAAFDVGAIVQVVADPRRRLQVPPAELLPRSPARAIVEEPEQAAAGDDAPEEADSEDVADNILDLDDEDDDDVELEQLPEKPADD